MIRKFFDVVLATTALCICLFHPASAQNLFTVASPTAGQVFAPGNPIPITVVPAQGITLAEISATSSIGEVSGAPGSLSLTAPETPFGFVMIAIIGETSAGAAEEVDVSVDIESPQILSSITVVPSTVALVADGTSSYLPAFSTLALDVIGTLADGTQADIEASTKTRYTVSNPEVVTIDSFGNVTAVAPGTAEITVTNSGSGSQVPVTVQVPITVNVFELRGDLDGDGDVDSDDVAVVVAALNTSATGPGDPRDLNGDGVINATDVSILQSLCSRQGCATQ